MSTRHPDDTKNLASAVYLQVRKKWRALYNSHHRLSPHDPRETSKIIRTLPRDVAVPAAQRFVIWAMDRLIQLHLQQQHQFMQSM